MAIPPTNNHLIILVNGLDLPSNLRLSCFIFHLSNLLKKAGEKIIGKKNQQTGEYEGGIVSGIVNPIRNFFKDKFQTVHDWFHNEGKFTSNDTGFKGFLGNFVNVFKYGVKLWQSGANTIINDVLPGFVEAIVSKLPDILK